MNKYKHYWTHCDFCNIQIIVCGKCGNNCCNAGYGEIDDIKCDACPSAYDMQDEGYKNNPNLLEHVKSFKMEL